MPPIFEQKHYDQPSVFEPANLLREARRQKGIPAGNVPEICLLDPDGDLFRQLKEAGAQRNPFWACYHTELYNLVLENTTIGVLGCAVGSSFAVLVAEQLFASGCQLLVSVTSAGQITPAGQPPYFVLIDRALRDEGTSYHYLPPEPYATIPPAAMTVAAGLLTEGTGVVRGGSWTTDAPFRETAAAIAFARSEKLLAVEMEAAALYALARAKGFTIICLAHVTNQMGMTENDFEKGAADGNTAVLDILTRLVRAWQCQGADQGP